MVAVDEIFCQDVKVPSIWAVSSKIEYMGYEYHALEVVIISLYFFCAYVS